MKPDYRIELERKIRAVARRYFELQLLKRNAPLVPLKEPIQKGFVRRYVLAPHAEQSKDAGVLRDILQRIESIAYCKNASFLRKSRKKSRRLVDIEQPLRPILVEECLRKEESFPIAWYPFFKLEFRKDHHLFRFQGKWWYIFNQPRLFHLRVRRYFLTHERLIDPLWIEESEELRDWMIVRSGWKVWDRLMGRRSWRFYNKNRGRKLKECQARKDLYNFLNGLEEVETRRWLLPFRFSFFFGFKGFFTKQYSPVRRMIWGSADCQPRTGL